MRRDALTDESKTTKPAHPRDNEKEIMKTNITDRIQWLPTRAWLPALVLLAAASTLVADTAKLPAIPRAGELRKRDPDFIAAYEAELS